MNNYNKINLKFSSNFYLIKMKIHLGIFLSLFFQIIITNSNAMMIPQDIEILDGYKINEPSLSFDNEYVPFLSSSGLTDTFLEADSLRNFALTKAIRNKRAASALYYKILESPGLRSHFHSKNIKPFVQEESDEVDKILLKSKRQKRSDKPSINTNTNKNKNNDEKESLISDNKNKNESSQSLPPNLPVAEKQVMEPPEYYRRATGWNIHSVNRDYARALYPDDDEQLPDATNIDGVIKGRSARVNFITQPKKTYDDIKERSIGANSKYSSSISALPSRYERVQPLQSHTSFPSDFYPSRSYDQYLRRYDRYDDQYNRYDPYFEDYYLYRRRFDPYDSYSPRSPSYPEPFYEYPDRQFDVPEPRDYRPIYSNDLHYNDYRSISPLSSGDRNNRRIIYYAHLPEIIRSPPSIDLPPSSHFTYGRDTSSNRYNNINDNRSSGSGSSSSYHNDRELHSHIPLDSSSDNNANKDKSYGFIKREKKDHRIYPSSTSYQKGSTTNIKQET